MDASPLVSTAWLADNLETVKVIDASLRMPGAGDAKADYERRHIPGAVFFNIDEIADQSSDLPHMLPPPDVFEDAVGAMGVSNQDTLIVYDDQGLFSAPRVWWTFRAMGHGPVAVLDGGLKKWLAEDRAVTDAPTNPAPTTYKASPRADLVVDASAVRSALKNDKTQVIDARARARFRGEAPEPRAGLLSGAMPGAKNAPFETLLNDNGALKPPDALRKILLDAGVNLEEPAVATCGSGVTAAVVALALETLGHHQWSIYDGSWAEWGGEKNDRVAFPVVAGA